MADRPTRDQVPAELTWNLSDIYPTSAAWEADLAAVDAALPALTAYRGRLGESAATLLAFLEERDAATERFEKVHAYAMLAFSTDSTSAHNQALAAREAALVARIGAAMSFVENDLLALPVGTLDEFLKSEPALAPYRKQLDDVLRQRGHILSPEAEHALAALDEIMGLPYDIWQRATAADLSCPSVRDDTGKERSCAIGSWQFGYSQAASQSVRSAAYRSLNAGLGAHKHTLATALAAHINRNVALARVRGYGSAEEMILESQQVTSPVYHSILEVVHDGMRPHVQRLIALRKRRLGLDQVHFYDLSAPLDPGMNPPFSFDECHRAIMDGLAVLGDEYRGILEVAFVGRWIDRVDNVGKGSGAFSSPVYGVHPYVFTTWHDQLRNVMVLAHELGHAGHAELSARRQIISNAPSVGSGAFTGADMPRFFIESPSTCNEVLVGRHLIETTSEPRLRRFIIEHFLTTFTHNMVTHLLEAHFEQRLYDLAEAGKPLTTDVILGVQGAVFDRFYGDDLAHDAESRLYWAQQPHFYMNLYPYTYSAGLSIGVSVAESIRTEGAPAVERWLDTLRAGNTLGPMELARKAGADMSGAAPLERAVALFGELVSELEEG